MERAKKGLQRETKGLYYQDLICNVEREKHSGASKFTTMCVYLHLRDIT